MTDCVLVERRANIVVITINRPEAMNAINRQVSLGIAAAVEELEGSPELLVGVITGAGGTFSAGMDLKAFLAREDISLPGRGLGGICRQEPRKPMIAAVEGWALAGGCELALACDLIVAAKDARLGFPEVKRNLVARSGGLLRLPRSVPVAIAMELGLTGDPLPVTEAHRHGLVNRLTPPGRALDGALELAERIAVNAPMAVAATKAIIRSALGVTLEEGFAMQAPIVDEVFASEDAQEGARAFAEKREPVWRGR